MNSKLFVCALRCFTLSGCAKFLDKFSRIPGGFTLLKIGHDRNNLRKPGLLRFDNPIETLTELSGGVMVYAKNTDTGTVYSTSGASEEDTTISLSLPFGPYEFYGVGWPTANLTGSPSAASRVRCGYGPAKELIAASDTVVLDMIDLNNCYSDTFFTPAIATTESPANSIAALKIIPCGKGVDVSVKDYAMDCNRSESSSYFWKGDPFDSAMDRAQFFSTSNVLMYMASKDEFIEPWGLYRHDFSSGSQTRVSLIHSSGTGIKTIQRVPGKEELLFTLDLGSGDRNLMLYKLADGSVTRLDVCGTNNVCKGAQEFRVSPDGSYVVFVNDGEAAGTMELYSIPLAGPTYPNTIISGTTTPLTNLGVYQCSSCGNDNKFFFEIMPTSADPFVVFSGTKANANQQELFLARLDGTSFNANISGSSLTATESGTKISGPELSGTTTAGDQLKFTSDGNHLVYHVNNTGVDKVYQIDVDFAASVFTASTPIQITSSLATSPYFKLGEAGKAVAFRKLNTPDRLEVIMWSLSAPASTIHQSHEFNIPSPNFSFGQVELTSGDAKVVYAVADLTTPSTPIATMLFGDTITAIDNTGTTTAVDLTGGSITGTKKIAATSPDHKFESFVVSNDGTKVIYIADIITDTVFEIFFTPIAGGSPVRISPTSIDAATKSVKSINQHTDNKVYFNADADGDGFAEMLSTTLSGSPVITNLGLPANLKSLHDVSGGEEAISSGFPVMASPIGGPNMKEAYLYDHTANTYQRITTFSGGMNTTPSPAVPDDLGAGRVRLRWMKNPSGAAPTTAFASDCTSYPSTTVFDGTEIQSTIRIPVGDGTSNRFPVEVDIFPLATSCSGSVVTYSFPHGLAGPPSDGASYAKLEGQGGSLGNLKLFLREK